MSPPSLRFAWLPLGLAGLAVVLGAASAEAALKKYKTRSSLLVFSANASPTLSLDPNEKPDGGFGVALVEDEPAVMRRLTLTTDLDTTFEAPSVSGFVYLSRKYTESAANDQTATSGSSASQIAWGTLTGWFLSGRNWCNAEPASLCLVVGDLDETTDPSTSPSPFYDIGTWVFHGTGFTAHPFVWTRITTNTAGSNGQYIVRGAFASDGTVPALPLAGVAVLGASIALTAAAALRRRGG